MNGADTKCYRTLITAVVCPPRCRFPFLADDPIIPNLFRHVNNRAPYRAGAKSRLSA